MHISTKGKYSLQALLYLAIVQKQSKKEEYSSIRDIAAKTGISEGYLEQLFIPLRKEGLVQGVRGPSGGYMLGKKTGEIIIGDILRAVEGNLRPTDCVEATNCPIQKGCLSRHTWAGLYEVINNFVDSITMEDLLKNYNTAGQDYSI